MFVCMHILLHFFNLFHTCTYLHIQGGSVVLIHNLKYEIYLSGQGSIASNFVKERGKVHKDEQGGKGI